MADPEINMDPGVENAADEGMGEAEGVATSTGASAAAADATEPTGVEDI